MHDEAERRAGFAEVFAVGEFRALWLSNLLSRVGDQLARVALAVIAYDRTGSAALTALLYSLTFVPALLGGPLLAGFADRHPRREVMIVCDVARTGLIALMAVPHMPFAALGALLFTAQLLDSPENAARTATTPVVLTADRYTIGLSALAMTTQTAGLAGFAVGGVLVAATGAPLALVLDAASFALSAAIVALGVRSRPAAAKESAGQALSAAASGKGPNKGRAPSAIRVVAADPLLRAILGLALLAGFYVVPEALAVPYAAEAHLGTRAAGLLMAALPTGNVLGIALLNRFAGPSTRLRLFGPLALITSLPLLLCAARPGLVLSMVLWAATGLLSSYQVIANAAFARAVPDRVRGRALGLAGSLLTAAQGLGMILAGVAAGRLDPAHAIAWAAGAGSVAGLPAAWAWRRARTAPTRPAGQRAVEPVTPAAEG